MSLRILIITQGVSRIVEPLVNSSHEVVAVLESAPRGASSRRRAIFLRGAMAWVASVLFSVRSLKSYCSKNSIAYRMMYDAKEVGLTEWVSGFSPDVIVVHSMSQLLRKNIYSLPRLGTINLHPSLLPRYRGPNPDFWHYYDVDLEPGVTVHYIDDGEDSGDIIAQDCISIELGLKSPERSERLVGDLGITLLLETLDGLAVGPVKRLTQPQSSPTLRARNLAVEEHATVIDWQAWPIERIWHVLRGTEQWLDAIEQPKGLFAGQRWSIGDYRLESLTDFPPGSVFRQNGEYRVACTQGSISLTCVFSLKRLAVYAVNRLFKKATL